MLCYMLSIYSQDAYPYSKNEVFYIVKYNVCILVGTIHTVIFTILHTHMHVRILLGTIEMVTPKIFFG